MTLRIGFDGTEYWVEERRWFGWRKCCDSNCRECRTGDGPERFATHEAAYEFARKYRLMWARRIGGAAVYAEVRR